MVTQVIYNSDLHFEHMLWSKELLFWKDEIISFQNRLEENSKKWTDLKILVEFGQYQHDFKKFYETINKYLNAIKMHEHEISLNYEANENSIDRVHLKYHEAFRIKLAEKRNQYNDLKNRYFKFLYKYL